VTHTGFYWLEIPAAAAKVNTTITASVSGQTVELAGDVPDGLTLHLSDELLDLDQPVIVKKDGETVFEGLVHRSREAIEAGLAARPDPALCPTATLTLEVE